MCEGRGQKVRAVFCRVIRTTSRALSLSSPVVFLNWRERQRFPTLAVSFVSLSTVLGKQQFSVLEYTSSLSLLFFSSHSLPLPHLSTRCLTSYRPAHPRVSPTSPISQCFSHPFSPIVPSLYFSFPLSVHLSHLVPLFIPPFSPLLGHRQLRDCTQRHSVHHLTLHPPWPQQAVSPRAKTRIHVYLCELAQPCIECLAQSYTWQIRKHLLPD